MSKITELKIENVKRIKYVAATLGDGTITIAGDNAQGKTSVLDSIVYALCGTRGIPDEPIRSGEKTASVVLDMDNGFRVERKFRFGKPSSLVITNADGSSQKQPQSLADSWWSAVAADPLEFSRARPERRLEVLRELTGLDLSDLDRRRQEAYDARRDAGRDLKRHEAALSQLPRYPDAPDVAPSMEDLDARYAAAQEVKRKRSELGFSVKNYESSIASTSTRIAHLEQQLRSERESLLVLQESMERDKLALLAIQEPDFMGLSVERENARAVSAEVAANAEHAKSSSHLEEIRMRHDLLDKEIQDIDAEKARRVAAAPLPVPEIGFGEKDVLLNGLPWEQASAAERLRVSAAMALASHPELRLLLIRDGSLLDRKSMQLLSSLAAEHDAQILIERIDTDGAEIVIEDGEVAK